MIRLLRNRNVLLAWLGGLISMTGDWLLLIALPLHIYQLTGSPLAMSGMVIADVLPVLLLGSVAGVFVDRWDRRKTMIVTNVVLAVSVLPLIAVQSAEWIWLAYLVTFVQSCASMFFRPAEHALLPRLVEARDLLAVNTLNSLNNTLARLIGPAVGGLVMDSFGLVAVVVLDAGSFLLAAVLLAGITVSGRAEDVAHDAAEQAQRAWHAVRREWIDGLRIVQRNRLVAMLLSLEGISRLGEGIFAVMFVIWVVDVLGGTSREFGWLMSAQAVGGLVGGVALGAVASRMSATRLFGAGSIAFGLLDLALFNYPLLVSGIWIGITLITMVGIPSIAIGAGFATLLQNAVHDAYRGRVFGIMGTTSALLGLVGTGIAGVLGEIVGPLVLLNLQGGSYVAMGMIALIALPRLLREAEASGPTAPERDAA